MHQHSKDCASLTQVLLSDPSQSAPCSCCADTLNALEESTQKLSDALKASRESQEKAEAERAAAELRRDLGEAAALRIARIIAEAEADKTIPSDPHCGEAIVLRRIKDALR